MSKNILFGIILLYSFFNAFAQVGIGTTSPAPGSILDINSSNSGVLIPRVELIETTNQLPITAPTPETGLLVFNTATINDVAPGFYYWTGTQWSTLSNQAVYGGNIQSVIGTTDAIKNQNTGFTDFDDITITFTPVHPVVYVTFSAAGHASIASRNSYIDFRLVNETAGNSIVAGTNTLSTDTDRGQGQNVSLTVSWNSSINMFPVIVTPGTSTTLKIQWNIGGIDPQAHYCAVSSLPDSSHRVLTILD
ncbi:hypothetical protein [Planktosalinus lacus]|uniref:Uncharacterized protein n=1 Tax=Planktosalinus lacus TaxID=1526573 RepID=A0A8J2Y942_9FLAO|nr:hypothetical protein [Planktosalinus lacus]GGD86838.1 hypothetical protein GCM10011312_08590 [Planktosalinus lacus]